MPWVMSRLVASPWDTIVVEVLGKCVTEAGKWPSQGVATEGFPIDALLDEPLDRLIQSVPLLLARRFSTP